MSRKVGNDLLKLYRIYMGKATEICGSKERLPLRGDSPQCGEMSRSDRGVRPRKRCHRR